MPTGMFITDAEFTEFFILVRVPAAAHNDRFQWGRKTLIMTQPHDKNLFEAHTNVYHSAAKLPKPIKIFGTSSNNPGIEKGRHFKQTLLYKTSYLPIDIMGQLF